MTGFLSRGVLVGDTRITVHDPSGRRPDRELDGVQKVHAVAPNIAIGFAGNIDAAMKTIGDARWNLKDIPEGAMLDQPSRFLIHWRRRLRWGWTNRLTDDERAGGLHLFYMCALPTEHPAFGRVVGWIVRSPEFEMERVPDGVARSIGSGSEIDEYVAELERISNERAGLHQFELSAWDHVGGPALPIQIAISDAIESCATPGISPHLVVCTVRWGEVRVGTNDREGLTDPTMTRTMPPIARNWAEWKAFKARHRLADTLALGQVVQADLR